MSPVESYTLAERKSNGVFYTPPFLAEYLAKKLVKYCNKRKLSTAIDPACGDGILLRALANEIPPRQALPKLFGIDKDLNAIAASAAKFATHASKKLDTQFLNTDFLFPIPGKNSVDGWLDLRSKLNIPKGFDVAISNPPWGADLDDYDPSAMELNFSLAKGQFDIFDLFVEGILQNLSDGGVFGLILPDSVFSQQQARFRRLLATGTTLHLIARLGEKIFPEINRACVVIVGSNKKPKSSHEVDCFRLSYDYKKRIISNQLSLSEVEQDLAHKVLQSRFCENDDYNFNIDLKASEQSTFYKIQHNSEVVKNFVTSTRGAEISKKGTVCQCPNCAQWIPFPKAKQPVCNKCKAALDLKNVVQEQIILNHNGIGNLKLKVGEDLYRYTSVSKTWISTLKKGINYKNLDIYLGDKILVRKTGIGITASLDYEQTITNQVVYILKLKPGFEHKLSLEFVLAVLNSRAMTYFLIKKYGENEWKSHPYLTQTMVSNLPFPKIDFDASDAKNLIDRITVLVRREVSQSSQKNISKTADLFIERAIAHFFKLGQEDYDAVFETLHSAQQLIPIRRLLNCNTKEIFSVDGF
jgi:adenine-specific DNA-methyltransferase